MKKCSTVLFYDRRSLMERCRIDPGRYSMIDEERWKNSKKNFDDIEGSLKDNEKMMIRFKSNRKDRRKKIERLLNVSYGFERSTKADGKMMKRSTALF